MFLAPAACIVCRESLSKRYCPTINKQTKGRCPGSLAVPLEEARQCVWVFEQTAFETLPPALNGKTRFCLGLREGRRYSRRVWALSAPRPRVAWLFLRLLVGLNAGVDAWAELGRISQALLTGFLGTAGSIIGLCALAALFSRLPRGLLGQVRLRRSQSAAKGNSACSRGRDRRKRVFAHKC